MELGMIGLGRMSALRYEFGGHEEKAAAKTGDA